MFKYSGYMGKILRVNLGSGSVTEKALQRDLVEKFLGGRGLAIKILFDEISPKTKPLDPQNKLIFMTGPLTGTGVPGSSRIVVSTKSPLTGIYTYAIAGSVFGPILKRSGYDGVIVEGKSTHPVYLLIDNGKASVRDADWLWGIPVFEATRLVKENTRDVSLAMIGPAGERLVKMAAVITDDRKAAARGGPGAVMGSKKLKAVAVRGKKNLDINDREKFTKAFRTIQQNLKLLKHFHETGTQAGPRKHNEEGTLPTRNWQFATFEHALDISHPSLREKFVIKDVGCLGCPVRCIKITSVRNGPYAGATTQGPEYETLYSLGSNCEINKPEALIKADAMCDDFGLDSISVGATLSWAMECSERGLLDSQDTEGVEVRFGDDEAMIKLIRKIAFRQGIGKLLAEGSRTASKKIGRNTIRYAMQVKGLELGGHDPRGALGQSVVFACGPRGGCHHALGLVSAVEKATGENLKSEGKGKLVLKTAIQRVCFDSSLLCTFHTGVVGMDTVANLLSAATDMNISTLNLDRIAVRTLTLERAFNAREGITREHDILPERLLSEPIPSGPNEGRLVTPDELEYMKDDFYRAIGWSISTGIPTLSRLSALDLKKEAEKMAKLGFS